MAYDSAQRRSRTLTMWHTIQLSEGLEQGWASFSHEGPDLEKLLKRAGRTLIGKQGEDLFFC